MKFLPPCYAIIPARYDSSRFPGKPLVEILGVPMCVRVHQRASRCPLFAKVVLATDDERIMAAAKAWNVPALLTGRDHQSGTDRVLEAARLLGAEPDSVVVNVQGDEPALDPAMLEELLAPFAGPDGASVQVATLAAPMSRQEAASRTGSRWCWTRSRARYIFPAPPSPSAGTRTIPRTAPARSCMWACTPSE